MKSFPHNTILTFLSDFHFSDNFSPSVLIAPEDTKTIYFLPAGKCGERILRGSQGGGGQKKGDSS